MTTLDAGSLASLLSGLVTGGLGVSQLMSNSTGPASATANPFGSQYANYQSYLPGAIQSIKDNQAGATNGVIGGEISALNNGNFSGPLQGVMASLSGLGGMTQQNLLPNTNAGNTTDAEQQSGGNLSTQLAHLNSNYMDNPAIQSMLKTGMDTVNRGLASQGLAGSGAQQVELQKYGENFAAQEYNQQFSNDIAGSNAAFTQNMNVTQEDAALRGQTFNQTASADTLLTQQFEGMGGMAGNIGQLNESATAAAGQLAGTNANLLLSSGQGLLNSLLPLSGATTGSPSTAGIIQSQQFGNTQQAVANLGSGLNGIAGGLPGLISGLTGGGGGGGIPDLGGLLSGLGTAGLGTDLGSELGLFSGGGAMSDIFGSSTTDLGSLIGDTAGGTGILGDVGATLGGLF